MWFQDQRVIRVLEINYVITMDKKTKKMKKIVYVIPYLDTNTSKQVENTKAFELTIIKELGKLTP